MEIEKANSEDLENCKLVYLQCVYMENGEILCCGKSMFLDKREVDTYIYKEKE